MQVFTMNRQDPVDSQIYTVWCVVWAGGIFGPMVLQ